MLKRTKKKKEKDEKMMKIQVARVYKSLKGLSSRYVNLQQLWRCIYVSPSRVRPSFQFGQVVFLCIFVSILYLWWWYICFSVWGQTGQVSNADLAFSLGKFYFHFIAYNITVPKVTFKYFSVLSVDTTTHHKPSKIVESHPQKDAKIQMLEG